MGFKYFKSSAPSCCLNLEGEALSSAKYCSSRSSVCLRKVPGLLFSFACWLVQLGFSVELGPAHFTRCLGKGRPHCRSVNSWSVQSWGRSMPLHWVVVVVVGIAEYLRIKPYCYRRHLGYLLWLMRLQKEGDKLPHGHKITPRNMYRLHCKHSRSADPERWRRGSQNHSYTVHFLYRLYSHHYYLKKNNVYYHTINQKTER